jgi:hypothetical protein
MTRRLRRWIRLGLFALLGIGAGAIGVAVRGATPAANSPQVEFPAHRP